MNVEPALRAGDALGGHFVQGHVDGVGRVRSVEPEGDGRRMWIEAPADVLRYCVEKGSITVSGVSLTIAGLERGAFAVALVPHTLETTTLGELGAGDAVNLEADVIGKYVERLLNPPGLRFLGCRLWLRRARRRSPRSRRRSKTSGTGSSSSSSTRPTARTRAT